jgi:hypothetical protein
MISTPMLCVHGKPDKIQRASRSNQHSWLVSLYTPQSIQQEQERNSTLLIDVLLPTHMQPPTHPSAGVPEWHAQDVGVFCAVDALNALIAGGAHRLRASSTHGHISDCHALVNLPQMHALHLHHPV